MHRGGGQNGNREQDKKESIKKKKKGSSRCGAMETNPTSNHEDTGSIPGLHPWVKDLALP